MRVDKAILTKGFLVQQAFFLDCWFNMSHELSLDSERAAYISPIRGVRELLSLFEMGDSFGAAGKRVLVAAELAEVLAKDTVLKDPKYAHIVERLTYYMDATSNTGEAAQCRVNRNGNLLISLCRELQDLLDKNYLEDAFQFLKAKLANFEDTNKDEEFQIIVSLTNSVIGALSANGADIQETNAFYRFILMGNGDNSFDDRLDHLISVALSSPEEYRLVFKIKSPALVQMLPTDNPKIGFGSLQIEGISEQELQATCTLLAQSYTTAGAQAYDLLGEFVDALSYTLGKQEITIVTRYTATQIAHNRTKSFKIHRPIPNPNYQFEEVKFLNFCQSMEDGNGSDNVGIKDNKISAAFRLLRVSSLATSTELKYTNYWTALESLARDVFDRRQGGDDDNVIAAALPCIAIDYVTKRLKSFIAAFHNIEVLEFQMPDGQPVFSLEGFAPVDLYDVLLNTDKREAVINQLGDYPFFQYKFKAFSEYFTSSLTMYERIANHEKKVGRQLKRIYRVRNLIVHDARNIEGLEQLCAHLEHYLKGCLNTMLEVMADKPTIQTPKEFFIRYHDLVDEVKTQLDPSWSKRENKRAQELQRLRERNYNEHSKLRELVRVHQ